MTTPVRNTVPFISVDNMMKLVNSIGAETAMAELAARIEADFVRWDAFEKIPRIASHSLEGVIELMPTSDGTTYAFKYVNGHPKNFQGGLQTVTAFGVLADVASGYPLLLTEMTILTALRTAATSAMAAKHLAAPGASVMAIIGNGAQSEFQALAFHAVLGIKRLRLYDLSREASRKCAENLARFGFDISICSSVEEAVEGAAIITTVTADKQNATILGANHVGPGVHLNAVGGDCPGKTELHPEILNRAATFVEYEPQTRIEGELQQMPHDHPVTELSEVLAGRAAGRVDPWQITLFDSVGFATEDFSALRWVYEKSQALGFYEDLDMIADPDDPRDLFGMLLRAGQ